MTDHSEVLSCAVCLHSFTSTERVPIDLGCGHCFCSNCIETSVGSFRWGHHSVCTPTALNTALCLRQCATRDRSNSTRAAVIHSACVAGHATCVRALSSSACVPLCRRCPECRTPTHRPHIAYALLRLIGAQENSTDLRAPVPSKRKQRGTLACPCLRSSQIARPTRAASLAHAAQAVNQTIAPPVRTAVALAAAVRAAQRTPARQYKQTQTATTLRLQDQCFAGLRSAR